MIKRLFLLAALLAGALVSIGSSVIPAQAAASACGTGAPGYARLASDPAGDTSYANEPVPNSTDSQEDIRFVDAAVATGTATFAIGVQDLTNSDPPNSVGLLASLTVANDAGASFTVDASRSFAEGNPGSGSINGVSTGVTATFDAVANLITVSGPASALPSHSSSITLTTAQTRADGGIVVAPLTDSASGDCGYTFGTPAQTAPFDRKGVTITVIDTGIEATNPEFDYNPAIAGPNGQMVGWWDFSATKSHAPCGATPGIWCSTQGPYDPGTASESHGTGTTGMAAGLNSSPQKTPSACPGCNLAVAKVNNEDSGSLDGDMAAAIYWAVDVVHTDVISVSIGALAPIPEPIEHQIYVAQRYARQHGVLLTFANGNGWGNAGIPGQPGGFMNYGNSVDVLSVGANGLDGFLVTTDPEVTGPFTVVTSSSQAADADGTKDGYHQISGTSFSTPFTAGLAAHLISSGRLCGATDLSPDFIEQLIKDTAVDSTTIPPSNEGYGEVSLGSMQTALGVLCNGDARPAVDPVTKLYVDRISGTERETSSQTVSGWTLGGPSIIRNPLGAKSSPGVLGLSTPDLADTEIYQITLQPGQALDDTFNYTGALSNSPDFDAYLYDVTKGVAYNGQTIRQASTGAAGVAEHLAYRNTSLVAQKLRVVLVGYTLLGRQSFSITGTPLGYPVDEGYAAVTVNLGF